MIDADTRFRRTYAVAAGLLVLAALATGLGSLHWSRDGARIGKGRAALVALDRAAYGVSRAEAAQRTFLYTGDGGYRTAFEVNAAAALRALQEVEQADEPALARQQIAIFKSQVETALRELRKGMETRAIGGAERAALAGVRDGAARIRSDGLQRLASRRAGIDRVRTVVVGISLAVCGFALAIMLWTGRATLNESRIRRAAEAAANEEREKFEALMRHIPSLVYIKDEDGRYIYGNDAVKELLDARFDGWLGKLDSELWPTTRAAEIRAKDQEVLRGDKPIEFLQELTLPEGGTRQFLSVRFPMRFGDGKRYLGGVSLDVTEHRATEEALRASQEFSGVILRSSQDCIKILDLDGRILMMNESGQQQMGIRDMGPLLKSDWSSFWVGDDHRIAKNAVADARAGRSSGFEGYCPTLLGEARWWNVIASPIRDESGKVSRILIVARDITSRKKVEQRVTASESRYRDLFEKNPLPALIYDIETGKFADLNQKALASWGYSRVELLGLGISDLWTGEDSLRLEGVLAGMDGGDLRTEPVRMVTKGMGTRVVEVTALSIEWFERPARLLMVFDLTERGELEERFRAVFAQSADAHLLRDQDRKIVDCNEAAVRMTGAGSREELMGLRAEDLMPERQLDGTRSEEFVRSKYEELEASGGAIRFDCVHRRRGGEEYFVNVSFSKVRINQRWIYLIVWRDLTERRMAEEALRESEARLREAQQIARLGRWEADLATGEATWSEEVFEIFGVDPEDGPLGVKEFYERVHSEDRALVEIATANALEHGIPYDIEYRAVLANGEVRHIRSWARRELRTDGSASRLRGSVLDVTQLRRSSAELEASEARFHAFMDLSPALAFIKGRDGFMYYMNRACEIMFQLTKEDWVGKTDVEIWGAEAAEGFRVQDLRMLDGGVVDSTIDIVDLPGGGKCRLLTYKFPLQMADGAKLIGGMSIDLTEQWEMAQGKADVEPVVDFTGV